MENEEIQEKVCEAIEILFSKDAWLLEQDLSERSIAHKLGEHLQLLFLEYNVDCEYNGNIANEAAGRKRISVLKTALEAKNLLKLKEEETETELADRSVFPDIIIHQRGTNEKNLCVIELKKSTSQVSSEYDEIKLKAYTSSDYGNNLKYQIGMFIEFSTGADEIDYDLKFFMGGQETIE